MGPVHGLIASAKFGCNRALLSRSNSNFHTWSAVERCSGSGERDGGVEKAVGGRGRKNAILLCFLASGKRSGCGVVEVFRRLPLWLASFCARKPLMVSHYATRPLTSVTAARTGLTHSTWKLHGFHHSFVGRVFWGAKNTTHYCCRFWENFSLLCDIAKKGRSDIGTRWLLCVINIPRLECHSPTHTPSVFAYNTSTFLARQLSWYGTYTTQ